MSLTTCHVVFTETRHSTDVTVPDEEFVGDYCIDIARPLHGDQSGCYPISNMDDRTVQSVSACAHSSKGSFFKI